jgi:hypothetical protein
MHEHDLERHLTEALSPVEPPANVAAQVLEQLSLRAALAPMDAPNGFAERVLVRISRTKEQHGMQRQWLAIAAMLALLAGGGWYWRQYRAAQHAAAQLRLALSISAQKLSQVQQGIVVEVPLGIQKN